LEMLTKDGGYRLFNLLFNAVKHKIRV
jgi:hypothetical protein